MIGKTIGKYQIVEHLGRGGMAEVYKAYQPALDRYVAVKLMHSFLAEDQDFLGRFQREAKAIGRLRHANIVQVHDFDFTDGIYYMVMEFIDGYTLKTRLIELANQNKTLPLREALRITRDVAAALDYAHERDMVHRDVKPANVMINKDNQVILTDFGIAKILSGPQFTASGAMIGTPAYMSPEQGLGEPGDARSDIYSLGIMLFQMVTGQLPYDADTPLAIVLKHVNNPLPIPSQLNPSMPPDIERIIFKALAKDPDDRYQSADELISHLDRVTAGLPLTGTDMEMDRSEMATVLGTPTPTHSGGSAATYARPPAAQTVAVTQEKADRPGWLLPVIGLVAVAAIVAVVMVVLNMRRPGDTETPTVASGQPTAVAVVPTNVEETPEPTEEKATPIDPVAAAQTALAQQGATLTAEAVELTAQAPTATYTPTPKPPTPTRLVTHTPTATPTAACVYSFDVDSYFTYNSRANYNTTYEQTSAPVDSVFPITIRLINLSTCPLPADSKLVLVDGDALGADQTIALAEETAPEGTADLSSRMTTDDDVGRRTSVWELRLPDNTPIGDPFEVHVYVYQPTTPTPIPPAATNTPTPAESAGPIDFNYFPHSCEYAGDQWRCWLTLTPYGGVGQPYTFFVFDEAQPVRYYGGNAEHLIDARRCSPWIHEIKLQDDGGNTITKGVYIHPDNLFTGGCVEP
jgi:hypothetical protein